MHAKMPRLGDRPLVEQWAVTLGEVDRLSERVEALERGMVRVALHTNAYRSYVGV